jgi:hypothetical protein
MYPYFTNNMLIKRKLNLKIQANKKPEQTKNKVKLSVAKKKYKG